MEKGPPSAIPLGFARGFGKTGQALSKSARRGAPPVVFVSTLKDTRVILPRYSGPPARVAKADIMHYTVVHED